MNRFSSFLLIAAGLTFGAAAYTIYFSKEDTPLKVVAPLKVPEPVPAAAPVEVAPVSLPVSAAAKPARAEAASAPGEQASSAPSVDIPVAEPDNPQTIGSQDRNRAAAAAQAAARAYYQSQQQQK